MSEWETIGRERGATGHGGVTVAWRVPGGKGRPKMCIALGRAAVEAFGLTPGEKRRVLVQRNRARGLLRLVMQESAEARSVQWTNGVAEIQVPLHDVTSERQGAALVEHTVQDGALVITLPAWANPPARVSVPPAAAKPTPLPVQSKEDTALSLLRARVGTDAVVRETGLSPRDVVRLAEQVRAERAGKAA